MYRCISRWLRCASWRWRLCSHAHDHEVAIFFAGTRSHRQSPRHDPAPRTVHSVPAAGPPPAVSCSGLDHPPQTVPPPWRAQLQYRANFMFVVIDRRTGELGHRASRFWLDGHQGRLARADGAAASCVHSVGTGSRCGSGMREQQLASRAGTRGLGAFDCGAVRGRGSCSWGWVCDLDDLRITTTSAITHVFFLPGHFLVALAAGSAIGGWRQRASATGVCAAALLYAE